MFTVLISWIFYLFKISYSFFLYTFNFTKPTDRLIIFTRYPSPGKTKKRLIQKLGEQGASNLQKEMTPFVVDKARQLLCLRNVELFIYYYTEATLRESRRTMMEEWLGEDCHYKEQCDGSLGVKMENAILDAFQSGMQRVVIIGSDCPGIHFSKTLDAAFERLNDADIVLGPALDGGYYLVGVRNPYLRRWYNYVLDMVKFCCCCFFCFRQKKRDDRWREIFHNIDWGTEIVLYQTLSIIEEQKLRVSLLDKLGDVDVPEDLKIWYKAKQEEEKNTKSKISIIIPVLNEGKNIKNTINSLKLAENIEILIVDGGSTDDTLKIAHSLKDCIVLSAPKGRASQMNVGAKHATGNILLFLHADTQLPYHYDVYIRACINQLGDKCGCFSFSVGENNSWRLALMERTANWRARELKMPYGDQCLFVEREFFEKRGRFPNLALMEDYEFVKQLKGEIRVVYAPVETSKRRWEKKGVFTAVFWNQVFIILYSLGVSTERIAHWYYGK